MENSRVAERPDKRFSSLNHLGVIIGATVWLTFLLNISVHRLQLFDLRMGFTLGEFEPKYFGHSEGWFPTAAGLAVRKDEFADLALSIYKSRFHDLLFELNTTEQGKGKVQVMFLIPPEAKPARDNVPEQASGQPPWQLIFGKAEDPWPASSIVQPEGSANLTQLSGSSGEFHIYIRPSKDAEGPLLKSVDIKLKFNRMARLIGLAFFPVILMAIRQLLLCFPQYLTPKTLIASLVTLSLFCWLRPLGILETMPFLATDAVGLALLPLLIKKGKKINPAPVLAALIIFLGSWMRWDSLNEMRFQPPLPDAVYYRIVTNEMSWFYDSQEREPLFIFLCKIGIQVFGDSDTTLRIVTFFLSILLILTIYLVGRDLFGEPIGLIAAALLAANGMWAWHAARGLRLELFTIALLVLTRAALAEIPSLKRHILWLGISSAFVCLVRLSALSVCLVAIVFSLYRRKWETAAFLKAAAIPILAVLPFVIQCTVKYGDPMHAVNMHVKYFRNIEFRDQPGFPTDEDIEKDSYTGPKVTPFQYFFGMHSLGELAHRTAKVFKDVLIGDYARDRTADGNPILFWWMVASCFLVVFSGHGILLLWIALLIGPTAWLYGEGFGPEPRHIYHISSVFYLCMAISLVRILQRSNASETNEKEIHAEDQNEDR